MKAFVFILLNLKWMFKLILMHISFISKEEHFCFLFVFFSYQLSTNMERHHLSGGGKEEKLIQKKT